MKKFSWLLIPLGLLLAGIVYAIRKRKKFVSFLKPSGNAKIPPQVVTGLAISSATNPLAAAMLGNAIKPTSRVNNASRRSGVKQVKKVASPQQKKSGIWSDFLKPFTPNQYGFPVRNVPTFVKPQPASAYSLSNFL